MATMPPQDPAMAEDAAPEADAPTPGYTICLHVTGDGAISVSVEPEGEEEAEAPTAPGAPEDSEAAEPEEAAQSVPNIREAIKLIIEIYKGAGEVPDLGAESADMEAGYKE